MPEYELTRDEMIGRSGMRKGDRITLTEMQAKPFGSTLVLVVKSNPANNEVFDKPRITRDLPPADLTPKIKPATPAIVPDDLTKIKGISVGRQQLLNKNGIAQFGQLVNADPVAVSMFIPQVNANMVKAWQVQAQIEMTKAK